MVETSQTLGIDFGTSNSAVGINVDGRPRLVDLEAGSATMPTAVFFDFEERRIVYGSPAQQALIEGDEGRYMRALKSLLGTSLMHESRMLLGKRMDFVAIVAAYLAQLKAQAEAATGRTFTRALSGRPVKFHSNNAARNAQAEIDLRACYLAAGFDDVAFMPEPEAAARANRDVLHSGDLGLIVDIGGGTSDFTLFRQRGAADIDILASNGVRLGGTDFDRELSVTQVMPLLGRGTLIKHAFGGQTHTAPGGLFNDFATWQKIPFSYTRETRRMAADLAKYAVEPDKLARLTRALDEELGHDIAFAVEAAKIVANDVNANALPEVDLSVLEKGLRVPLPAALLSYTLAEMAGQIAQAALDTVEDAAAVDKLVLVGGSSLMGVVDGALRAAFPRAEVHRGAALTAIVDGLALASDTAFD